MNRVFFENCGIDDEELATIIQACHHLNDFKSSVYKQNAFGEKSLAQLPPLMHKKQIPHHLEEFRLIDCKITQSTSCQLVNTICSGSMLFKLALVNANLSETSIKQLAEFSNTSAYLRELDLSWCKTPRTTWTSFWEEVKSNRQLRELALVGNLLLEQNEEASTQTLAHIVHFIKKNHRVQHINFTSCGLHSLALKEIGASLRRTGSLLAIHLCSNPGVEEPGLIDWIRERVGCAPEEKQNRIPNLQ